MSSVHDKPVPSTGVTLTAPLEKAKGAEADQKRKSEVGEIANKILGTPKQQDEMMSTLQERVTTIRQSRGFFRSLLSLLSCLIPVYKTQVERADEQLQAAEKNLKNSTAKAVGENVLAGDKWRYTLEEGHEYLAKKDFKNAINTLATIEKEHESSELLFMKATAQIEEGQFKEASDNLQKAYKLAPWRSSMEKMCKVVNDNLITTIKEKKDKTIEDLEILHQNDPKDRTHLNNLLDAYYTRNIEKWATLAFDHQKELRPIDKFRLADGLYSKRFESIDAEGKPLVWIPSMGKIPDKEDLKKMIHEAVNSSNDAAWEHNKKYIPFGYRGVDIAGGEEGNKTTALRTKGGKDLYDLFVSEKVPFGARHERICLSFDNVEECNEEQEVALVEACLKDPKFPFEGINPNTLQRARNGDAKAISEMAKAYENIDLNLSLRLYMYAAKLKDPEALYRVALRYASKETYQYGYRPDFLLYSKKPASEIVHMLTEAASQGHVLAMYELGRYYKDGRIDDLYREKKEHFYTWWSQDHDGKQVEIPTIRTNINEAEKWLLAAAKKGNLEAQQQLELLYVTHDKKKAENYYKTIYNVQTFEMAQYIAIGNVSDNNLDRTKAIAQLEFMAQNYIGSQQEAAIQTLHTHYSQVKIDRIKADQYAKLLPRGRTPYSY